MADLSHLGGLNPIEQLDLENYAPVKQSTFQLPPKGVYTLRAPDAFPDSAFGRTKGGALSVQIDPTIVGPTHEGFTVRFTNISNKVFERNGKKVSQVGDYLKAHAYSGILRTEQDVADAVESTAGMLYEARLDWRAYNKRTGWSLEGMEKFPFNKETGTYQSWVIDPTEVGKTDDQGRQLRVFASLTIPFGGFIPRD
jgi:hypothetical protein